MKDRTTTLMMVGSTVLAVLVFFAWVQPEWRQPVEPNHAPPSFYPFALSDEQVCDVCLFYGLESGGCDDCKGTGGETYVTWPNL